jgi:hypothetical protein
MLLLVAHGKEPHPGKEESGSRDHFPLAPPPLRMIYIEYIWDAERRVRHGTCELIGNEHTLFPHIILASPSLVGERNR